MSSSKSNQSKTSSMSEKINQYRSKLIPVSRLINRIRRSSTSSLSALPNHIVELAQSRTPSKGIDMRSQFGPVYDQMQIGSCTANAICGAYKLLEADKKFNPSRLYVYAKERLCQSPNQPLVDSGSDAAIGLDWIRNHGVCPESDWPYDQNKVNIPPPSKCDIDARSHKLTGIHDLTVGTNGNQNTVLQNMCTSLDAGLPVLLAITIYDSFMTEAVASSGVVPMPNKKKENLEGGHEVCVVGYQPAQRRFIVANSWASDWGANGFFYLPYDYILDSDLSFEFLCFSNIVELRHRSGSHPGPHPGPHPGHPSQFQYSESQSQYGHPHHRGEIHYHYHYHY